MCLSHRCRQALMAAALALCILALASCADERPAAVTTAPAGTTEPAVTGEPAEIVPGAVLSRDGFSFTVNDDAASLTVTSYDGNGGDVVIPDAVNGCPVTALADMLFLYRDDVTSVTYPATVKATGNLALGFCPNVTRVVLPEGVTEISFGTFRGCTSLSDVTLPSTVTTLGEIAFNECSSLKTLAIGPNVTKIGSHCFATSGVVTMVIPETVTEPGIGIFHSCESLVDVTWCATDEIPHQTFFLCTALKNVTFGDSVTDVANEVFYKCSAIETLTLGKNTDYLKKLSLYGLTSLKTLNIPCASFRRLGNYTLHFMPNLTDIYFAGTEETWAKLRVGDYNEGLDNATVHFNADFSN